MFLLILYILALIGNIIAFIKIFQKRNEINLLMLLNITLLLFSILFIFKFD